MPILKGYPAKYIYDPWNAPEAVQKAAKCVIGKDYPVPMVNHAKQEPLEHDENETGLSISLPKTR